MAHKAHPRHALTARATFARLQLSGAILAAGRAILFVKPSIPMGQRFSRLTEIVYLWLGTCHWRLPAERRLAAATAHRTALAAFFQEVPTIPAASGTRRFNA